MALDQASEDVLKRLLRSDARCPFGWPEELAHIFDRLRDGRSGLLTWHPSTFTNRGQNPYDFERAESVLLELDRIVKRLASMAEPPDQAPDLATSDRVATGPETSGSKTAKHAQAPAAPAPPIVLGGPDDAPIVRGIEKDILTPTQYRVVKALLDAFPSRVAGDSLARKSMTDDPVGVIDRLNRDKDWASVLSKAGKVHGGYGIVSTPRKTQKNRETRPRKPRG